MNTGMLIYTFWIWYAFTHSWGSVTDACIIAWSLASSYVSNKPRETTLSSIVRQIASYFSTILPDLILSNVVAENLISDGTSVSNFDSFEINPEEDEDEPISKLSFNTDMNVVNNHIYAGNLINLEILSKINTINFQKTLAILVDMRYD